MLGCNHSLRRTLSSSNSRNYCQMDRGLPLLDLWNLAGSTCHRRSDCSHRWDSILLEITLKRSSIAIAVSKWIDCCNLQSEPAPRLQRKALSGPDDGNQPGANPDARIRCNEIPRVRERLNRRAKSQSPRRSRGAHDRRLVLNHPRNCRASVSDAMRATAATSF